MILVSKKLATSIFSYVIVLLMSSTYEVIFRFVDVIVVSL